MADAQTPETPREGELLEKAQAREAGAFEALVALHRDQVFGLALRMTGSEADAQEITQETFLSAYQHLKEFRGEAAFGSWVHRIAANEAIGRLRRRKVQQATEEELKGPQFNEHGSHVHYPASDWSRRADEKALDQELASAISKATAALPDGFREVFLLRDVEGLSYEQVAEMTGLSLPAVKSRLHRARLALREAIDRFYNEA
jgi:RNA polymerase sigma-70 factor (ECF subfamily)